MVRKRILKKQASTARYQETDRLKTDILRIFENGTERELMQFLRENGVKDDSPRFAEILKLFREHGAKRL